MQRYFDFGGAVDQYVREWENFRQALYDIKLNMDNYAYDPYEPQFNDVYDYEESQCSEYHLQSINYLLFSLPKKFYPLTLQELLTPLQPPDLPKVPNLPPLTPVSQPESYSKRHNIQSFFNGEKWLKKAKEQLSSNNFKKKFISFEEKHLISNLVSIEESVELSKTINATYLIGQQKYDDAFEKLKGIESSLKETLSSESVCKVIEISHRRHFLPKFLKKEFSVAINPDSKIILIQFEFPDYSGQEFSFSTFKNKKSKYLTATQRKKAIKNCLYSLIIRAGYLTSILNFEKHFQSIVINVEQSWFDPATGQPRNGIIASLQASTDYFKELDLSKLDPEACFKSLKGLIAPSLENISPIRPIFVLNREDKRFIQSKDLDVSLIPESNLAAMEWEDFEHLVAQLFEWEFGKNGVEVKVTRASRDRGVDAVVFDPDPLRGGKYVLQAKRYTRTVDVSSVRDLYGTVINEGANRGILITTASFGPDSYEFAKDKPISLVDGPNLLLMFQRHGKKFRINLEEARALNNQIT